MPPKLFGIRLPGSFPTHPNPFAAKNSPNTSTVDLPSSMEFKRPSGLGSLAKLHGSSDKKDRRSRSKDSKQGKNSNHGSRQTSPARRKPIALGMHMESPPVFFIGPPQASTGALLSGRLQITPQGEDVTLENVTMYLGCKTTTKRPVENKCRDCMSNISDIFDWNFLSKAKTFKAQDGMAELPFSHLIPGHLPATTHGQLGSLDYSLHVKAKTSEGQIVEFSRELVIRRALIPVNEKNSTRIFPPTNLTLHVTLPHMVHPIGEFPVMCRMTGLTTKREDTQTQTRWRLRKLTWRIEEVEKMESAACPKHAGKISGEVKRVTHENTREIGVKELKSGWKTDFDEGSAEGEFMASFDSSAKPNCGMEAANGLKISHHLILELVIAEEWASNKKPQQATPTGAARVLRTQFNLNVTERAGMGLSWDDEMPPMYEDVPASPPHYAKGLPLAGADAEYMAESPPHYAAEVTSMMDYEGDDIHEDVESLNLGS